MARRRGLLWQETEQPVAGAGSVDTGVKAPFTALMLKGTTASAMWSPTNSNVPSFTSPIGAVMPAGLEVAVAEPAGVRAPVTELIANTETVFPDPVLPLKPLTKRNVPVEFTDNPKGLAT